MIGPEMNVADELATVLFAIDVGRLGTAAFTARITSAIVEWAILRGWSVRTEARVLVPRARSPASGLGYVDVLVGRGAPDPDLAIEIDSTDKQWSLAKLRHAAEGGMQAIWVRWGDDDWAGVYDDVDVIQLRALRRRTARDEPS